MTERLWVIDETRRDENYTNNDPIHDLCLHRSTFVSCTFNFNVWWLSDGSNPEISNCKFINCVFKGDYFEDNVIIKNNNFEKCRFNNIRFVDCDFTMNSFTNCDFLKSTFPGCYFGKTRMINCEIMDSPDLLSRIIVCNNSLKHILQNGKSYLYAITERSYS
jgi:uncharacterized protein YjbI with pentapeptide repeats